MCHSTNLQYGCHATQKLIWNSQRNSFAYIKRVTCRTNSANICSALFIQFFSVWTKDSARKKKKNNHRNETIHNAKVRTLYSVFNKCSTIRRLLSLSVFCSMRMILINQYMWMNEYGAVQCSTYKWYRPRIYWKITWTVLVINSLIIIFPSNVQSESHLSFLFFNIPVNRIFWLSILTVPSVHVRFD